MGFGIRSFPVGCHSGSQHSRRRSIMARVCNIVLVCEGWRDSAFARRFLNKSDNHNIVEPIKPGGSGHDWVKTQFVLEVAYLRRFSEGRGVLGLLDEDGQGASVWEREIEEVLRSR